jgi:D-aspartate ligase
MGTAGGGLVLDGGVPALVLKVGQYPVHSGPVGVIRSLGRLGVPVFAVTEPGVTPAGVSRFCAGRFVWRVSGREDPSVLAGELAAVGRAIGRRSVVVPVDDESAVLVAEHAGVLSEFFVLPGVAAGLPRRLASKAGLAELCREHGVGFPVTVVPGSREEVAEFAASAVFPVVVKNAGTWDRRRNPVGASVGGSASGTIVIDDADRLLALVRSDGLPPGFIVQEYIPPEHAENWFAHLYADSSGECRVVFTGVKARSWPVRAGVTACGFSVANPELAELASRFCKQLGYRGIADMDWVRDRRDGRFKLVDFNPRMGNQFRLFETGAGVDVVRAMHLDLTGREVPAGVQVEGRRIVVEHIDWPARVAYRRLRRAGVAVPGAGGVVLPRPAGTERAWLAADDPLPALAVLARPVSVAKILQRGRRG